MFQLSGIGIIAIAVWTLIDKSHYISLLSSITYSATVYIMLITGGIIILVGILGCCGACRDSASWSTQFFAVGVKSIQGMPKPATVNVSSGLRRLCENAQ